MERNGSASDKSVAVVKHGGREFTATAEMTQIFRRQAERVLASGASDLVVLRHLRGVDLLLITSRESYSIVPRSVRTAETTPAVTPAVVPVPAPVITAT
jgi:hypothetical protein